MMSVLVAGPFGAGKTTFIRTVSEKFLTAERGLSGLGLTAGEWRIKRSTTVFADIGVVDLEGRRLLLYGAPGQSRFEFVTRCLAARCRHLIFLVDTSDRAAVYRSRLYFDRFIAPFMSRFKSYLVALNKRDVSPLALRDVVQLLWPTSIVKPVWLEPERIVELVALDRGSCMKALRMLVAHTRAPEDISFRRFRC